MALAANRSEKADAGGVDCREFVVLYYFQLFDFNPQR